MVIDLMRSQNSGPSPITSLTIDPEGLQVNLIESKIDELLTLTSIISPAFDSLIPP
jgi:hypothetical protein